LRSPHVSRPDGNPTTRTNVVIFLHVKHSSNVLSIAQRLLRIIVICTFSLRRCGLHNNMKILLFLFCLLQVSRNPDICPEASALSRRRDTRPWPVGAQRTVSSQPLATSFARVPDKVAPEAAARAWYLLCFLSIYQPPHSWSADSRIRRTDGRAKRLVIHTIGIVQYAGGLWRFQANPFHLLLHEALRPVASHNEHTTSRLDRSGSNTKRSSASCFR
jgi:hypothetical protein